MKRPRADEALAILERVLSQKMREKQKELSNWRAKREEAALMEEKSLREISEMELALGVVRRVLGLEAEARSTELEVLRFRNQTVVQSSLDIMGERGGRARVKDIVDVLVRAGKLKNRRTGYAIVTKALDRDERFTRISPGEFQVSEGTASAALLQNPYTPA